MSDVQDLTGFDPESRLEAQVLAVAIEAQKHGHDVLVNRDDAGTLQVFVNGARQEIESMNRTYREKDAQSLLDASAFKVVKSTHGGA